jgi:hypothetical protein
MAPAEGSGRAGAPIGVVDAEAVMSGLRATIVSPQRENPQGPRPVVRRSMAMRLLSRDCVAKSFCTGDQKFCGLQVRLSCKDARDLIASP